MRSNLVPAIVKSEARYEIVRVEDVETVVQEERVVLDLSLAEFLSLYGLHYVHGSGNPRSGLRYKVEAGLHEAEQMLVRTFSTSERVKAFMRSLTSRDHKGESVYNRIDAALEAAEIER